MNGGQKAIVCVALGAVLVVVGFAARAMWWDCALGGGWFNYAPNNGVIFSEDPMHDSNVLSQAAMWIALVLVWLVSVIRGGRRKRAAMAHLSPPPPPHLPSDI